MNRLVQKTITPGEGDDHTMFWSELCSLLSILLLLSHMIPDSNQPKYQVACNGKFALIQIQASQPVDAKEQHADLILACQEWIQWCPCKLEWHHVKEHQDGMSPMVLARDALLNIEA